MLTPGSKIKGTGTDPQNNIRLRWIATLSYEPTTGAQGWDILAYIDNRKIVSGVVLAHNATEVEVVRKIADTLQKEFQT